MTDRDTESEWRTASDVSEANASDSRASMSRRGALASLVGVGGLGLLGNPVGAAVEDVQWRSAATAAPDPQYGHTATFPNPEPPEEGDDHFADAVAVSGDATTALVGAPEDSRRGRVYAYTRTAEGWDTENPAVIPGPEPDMGFSFGEEVALSADGSTALVGAPVAATDGEIHGGEAYLFTRAGGEWDTENPVRLSDPESDSVDDQFGAQVALSADGATALVSSPEDPAAERPRVGEAYVFTRTGGEWNTESPVTLPNPDPDKDDDFGDEFGESVALSGDGTTALIGVRLGDVVDCENAGVAYVFRRTAEGWNVENPVRIPNPDPNISDAFGWSVALNADGTTALVSSGEMDVPLYVFERTDAGWDVTATISPPKPDLSFDGEVALSADGKTALATTPNQPIDGVDFVGRGYVFTRTAAGWDAGDPAVLSNPTADDLDYFGSSATLSADGATALLGAPNKQTAEPAIDAVGEAYAFERGAESGDGADGGDGSGDGDEDQQPTVAFDDQDTDGSSVAVQSATLPEGGFVVIHGESGAVLGHSAYLEAGTHSNVAVTLDNSISADQTLIAMLHVDDGDQTYEFPDADSPYTTDSEPVTDDASVTLIC